MSSDKIIQTNYIGISCFEMNRWIEEYFTGKLFGKAALKIDRHLSECERCNGHYREFLEDFE